MYGSNIIIILFVVVTMVAQVAWARCNCDPADTLCLNSCVNSARDCISNCDGKNGDSCYTSCINVHWPGATFEDAGIVVDTPPPAQATTIKKVTPTTKHMASFPTTTKAVGSFPTEATTAAGPADDLIPFLMSIFDLPHPKSRIIPASKTLLPTLNTLLPTSSNTLTGILPASLPSNLTLELSSIPSLTASQFSISVLIPSFTTTHTTVTSLVTVTPNLSSVSATNNNTTSHGMKNLVDPWVIFIVCFFLSFTTFNLV